jgi:DNA-binding NarL/FixJ family response regulator
MFEVVNRSLALLKTSTLLRSYASQTRLGARLVRHALFLKTNEEPELLSYFEQPVIPVEPQPSDEPGPANAGDQAEGNPSPREREVLHLLADGKSNKEIALILAISTRTVEAYRARVMTKLDLHTTAALVRYAVRHKIIEA